MFSASMIPSLVESGPSTNSILAKYSSTSSLKQKLLDWMPKHHLHLIQSLPETVETKPDWSQEFWTPIDVDVSTDSMVTLCKLNFREYSEHPHMYAMFRDLVNLSQCMGSNRKRERLSVLLKEIENNKSNSKGRVIPPTGFIFHESRVGSTLIANVLGSDPWSLVFSESTPAANAILHCDTCSHEEQIKLIRDVFTVMGQSPYHKRLFFKFQSITSTKMDLVLEAFPDTPWAFVYRQPVQTMMSHLDPKKSSAGAPCLRSMRNPPDEVRDTISSLAGVSSNPPKEAWCAAHLNMLCSHAIDAFERFSTYSNSETNSITNTNSNSNSEGSSIQQRGFLINYESLPGVIPTVILPMFGIQASSTWLERMSEESMNYSKGRTVSRKFEGDSEDKDERATAAIQKYATSILSPTFEIMKKLSNEALKALSSELYTMANPVGSTETRWNVFQGIPTKLSSDSVSLAMKSPGKKNQLLSPQISPTTSSLSSSSSSAQSSASSTSSEHSHRSTNIPHSKIHEIEYVPWAPFSNTHNSRAFERVECPIFPIEGYPKSYEIPNLLNNWNTDSTEIPAFHYDSLCHFDFQNETELTAAYNYREKDVPFVVYNIPEVDKVAKNWGDVDYLHKKLGNKKYRTETSNDNHFMYWRGSGTNLRGKDGQKWKPPTGITSVTFEDWMELAVKGQNTTLEERTHQYFRVSSDLGNEWIYEELPFFQPKKSLMLVDPKEQRGIHCRFGMRSVIAEAHFDGSRNSVVMLGGLRRWILTHPNQCGNMYMLPNGHPSGRHSQVDWSNPDYKQYPDFAKVRSNEVILQPGDMLYVPTFWIHYIISLNINYQCNTRSGRSNFYNADINACGF